MESVDTATHIRAAALELAAGVFDRDTIMVPATRALPAAEEIVETARVFEAYLRGETGDAPAPTARPGGPIGLTLGEFVGLLAGPARDEPDADDLDHLAKCSGCRQRAIAQGKPVPPWLGGRSGG
ncbi:hypothetical protein [Actinoplanes rectilineatus]|uniref:hypothetical protein n=1 Tax=Actinoplanes rectilineatus TaxID=113571 RepID=UPI000A959F18|nr:hypothetical protein [Actinoplanes rectilineatus]